MADLTTTETATAATALTAIAGPGHFGEKLAYAVTNGHFIFRLGGHETTLATTQKDAFRAPFPFVVTGVSASVGTVSSSGLPTFDVNKNGTTFLPTKLTIDASEKTSATAAAAAVLSSTASDYTFALDDEISVDVDVAGTGTAGGRVIVSYTRTG